MNLDVIVFAAHPDDAELSMGGTIAKLTRLGYTVGIIDLTKGELGTRGTPEIRQEEAANATKILKVVVRENLQIPDGDIRDSKENLEKIIVTLRKYKPKIIFAPYFNDRHPDHIDASRLVKRAVFTSGLEKIKTYDKENLQEHYRPAYIFYYMQTYTFEPSFIIDVSDSFEEKMNAVRAFASQFHKPQSKETETFISRPNFIDYIESRASFYGFQIHTKYGEAFYCEEKINLDISGLLKK
jgi:bacillithiol biosynthesis deacetylase BshB1